MPLNIKVPFFEPYWQKKEIESIKRDAEQSRSLVELMLEETKQEQQIRLQTIRETGPWELDWEIAVRQQKERALQAIRRLKRYREMGERIRQLEEKLPPTGGLNGLR